MDEEGVGVPDERCHPLRPVKSWMTPAPASCPEPVSPSDMLAQLWNRKQRYAS